MAQFDVHRYRGRSAEYVINLQSDLLSHLGTRVVAPLFPESDAPRPLTRLNPVVDLGGRRYRVLTQQLAAVRNAMLGETMASLEERRVDLIGALDFLLTGI